MGRRNQNWPVETLRMRGILSPKAAPSGISQRIASEKNPRKNRKKTLPCALEQRQNANESKPNSKWREVRCQRVQQFAERAAVGRPALANDRVPNEKELNDFRSRVNSRAEVALAYIERQSRAKDLKSSGSSRPRPIPAGRPEELRIGFCINALAEVPNPERSASPRFDALRPRSCAQCQALEGCAPRLRPFRTLFRVRRRRLHQSRVLRNRRQKLADAELQGRWLSRRNRWISEVLKKT